MRIPMFSRCSHKWMPCRGTEPGPRLFISSLRGHRLRPQAALHIAIARARRKTAMGEMMPAHLLWRAQIYGQRFPALAEKRCPLDWMQEHLPMSVPPRAIFVLLTHVRA